MRKILQLAALGAIMAMLAGCDLAITKTASPDPATEGRPLTYTLEVTNLQSGSDQNNQGVPNVLVSDALPESVDFISAAPSQGVCQPADAENRVLCTLGPLALNAKATVDIAVTPTEVGRIRNTAETQMCSSSTAVAVISDEGTLTCAEPQTPDNTQERQIEALELREAEGSEGFPTVPPDPQENNTVTITTLVNEFNSNVCTITGTPGNDILRGTAGRDVICGAGGNDLMYGLGGGDVLRGGAGNDTGYGELGNDVILGGVGKDIARGGDGDDRIEGEDGNDTLYGELGNDTILGGAGNDTLRGGPGQDTLNGGPGRNSVRQ
ncbi:DUF11 domain-containing protein [Rubrobacter indicoceani]|uniref:DUF11 domain-containing protein n=1 Tax=Rubrobacter indicoceani TaxID=2051957 RepID=UPI0013C4688F|nr:DUF11 domain-containing protein [Rubrobacter indicoceani]